mmetsp:Transcript_6493/g.4881  ORF Transcript_6493/g.4881 Transcript_6493/m.4881 type:complete len:106 (+) Transcript_6493:140-457(+)
MVAVKAIDKKQVQDYLSFKNEIELLKTMDHPNIIKLYELWENNFGCFIVEEYCEGGALFHYLYRKQELSELKASQIMKQCLLALNYLHQNKISHRYDTRIIALGF